MSRRGGQSRHWLSSVLNVLPGSAARPNLRGEYVRVEGHELGDVSAAALVEDHEVLSKQPIEPQEPNELELRTLKRVSDDIPWGAFLIVIVELCERFAYYGLMGPFQNYLSNKWHDPNGLPGAIGLGQSGATGLTNFFTFWGSTMPIFAAIVADQYLGRYLTVKYAMMIYMTGIFILFITSIPLSIRAGTALPGFLVAMLLIGMGGGGIRANVSSLIAEQYTQTKLYIRVTASGKRVVVDPAVTISRIFSIFYLCINVGSLSPILTTSLEFLVGFWASFLLCFCMFVVGFIVLIYGKRRYVLKKPGGSPVFNAFRIIAIALRKQSFAAAKPESLTTRVPWTSAFVDELQTSLHACRVFLFFPIYWLAYGQMSNNFVSQAGQMERHSIPNDIMVNLNPICVIIMIPVCERYVHPFLARYGVRGHVNKITLGFILGAIAMAWAGYLQHSIYSAGPCYTAPLACEAALRPDGTYAPNEVSVLWQMPVYVIIALSEIFASIPGMEFAYTKAPAELKSFVMGLFILTNASSAVIGMAVSPFAVDPKLTYLYLSLAVLSVMSATALWLFFHRISDEVPSAKGQDHESDL